MDEVTKIKIFAVQKGLNAQFLYQAEKGFNCT